jgi:hypothetical protein
MELSTLEDLLVEELARTYANLLGYKKIGQVLQQTLNEEGDTDKALTKLAESINVEAADEDEENPAAKRNSQRRATARA